MDACMGIQHSAQGENISYFEVLILTFTIIKMFRVWYQSLQHHPFFSFRILHELLQNTKGTGVARHNFIQTHYKFKLPYMEEKDLRFFLHSLLQ